MQFSICIVSKISLLTFGEEIVQNKRMARRGKTKKKKKKVIVQDQYGTDTRNFALRCTGRKKYRALPVGRSCTKVENICARKRRTSFLIAAYPKKIIASDARINFGNLKFFNKLKIKSLLLYRRINELIDKLLIFINR